MYKSCQVLLGQVSCMRQHATVGAIRSFGQGQPECWMISSKYQVTILLTTKSMDTCQYVRFLLDMQSFNKQRYCISYILITELKCFHISVFNCKKIIIYEYGLVLGCFSGKETADEMEN